MPMIRARKTAASEATWYLRSNISELRGSLAQRVQPVERVARQGAPQAHEEWAADGQNDVRAVVAGAGEGQLDVDALAGHVPGDTGGRLDGHDHECACHVGAADQARAHPA